MDRTGELFIGGSLAAEKASESPVRLPAHHLCTHGVIVGMTGSGKSGLGVVLLEEVLLSGVPSLIIDPKGDMGNLLLQFPEFRGSDFRPWIDEGEARRSGKSPDEFAEGTASMWSSGLGKWGIASERLRRIIDTVDVTIYTPGSKAGVPVNIVGSLQAPKGGWDDDEALRDEIEGFVSSLLSLAGLSADPMGNPEHVLLSTIIEQFWREGRDLDLPTLVRLIPQPPVRKLGVFDIDDFIPQKQRAALALRLNTLLASPSFATWLEGEPLDIQRLLWTPEGKPRAAILYLSHLSEEERRFVVTLALSKMITWFRNQPGTSDLRALVYMDEVYGYAPPTAAPPSKKPILTILKQARAFGVGLILATQNPVDLDYKAMSNAGTWMVGRLQTERDKSRILEALRSASGGTDVEKLDQQLGGLGKREFLLYSTRDEPQLFTTRWAMSYLRGALTREEVRRLMEEKTPDFAPVAASTTAVAHEATPAAPAAAGTSTSPLPPKAPSGVPVRFMDSAAPWASDAGADRGGTVYRPGLAARLKLRFDERTADLDHIEEWEAVYFPLDGAAFDAERLIEVDYDDRDFRTEPPAEAGFDLSFTELSNASLYKNLEKAILDHVYREEEMVLFKNPALKLVSRPGEAEADFRKRCEEAAEAAADEDIVKVKERYEQRIDRVRDQMERAEQRLRELEIEKDSRSQQEWINAAGALLSVVMGGKAGSRKLSSLASRRSRTRQAAQRLATAEGRVEDYAEDIEKLEVELADEIAEIGDEWLGKAGEVEPLSVRLERNDMTVEELALVWLPAA